MTTGCAVCAWHWRVIRREVALNEKRLSVGRATDMAQINAAKSAIAACVSAGHHDPHVGSDARWHTPEPA